VQKGRSDKNVGLSNGFAERGHKVWQLETVMKLTVSFSTHPNQQRWGQIGKKKLNLFIFGFLIEQNGDCYTRVYYFLVVVKWTFFLLTNSLRSSHHFIAERKDDGIRIPIRVISILKWREEKKNVQKITVCNKI
jgi:hypothetical protein